MTGAPDALTLQLLGWSDTAHLGGYNEQFAPGAFTATLRSDPSPPLLWVHDNQTFPIGRVAPNSLADNGDGPTVIALLDLADPRAAEAARKAGGGYLQGVSVSFVPERSVEYPDTPGAPPDHAWKPLVVRRQVRLLEVSLTPVPAYPGGRILGPANPTLAQRNSAIAAHRTVALQRALGQHPRQTRRGSIGYIHTDSTPRYR